MYILIGTNINKAVPLVSDKLHDCPGQPWSELGGFQALLVQFAALATIMSEFML